MITKSIYVASGDYTRLRLLAAALTTRNGASADAGRKLLNELDRCIMLAAHEMPPGIVQIESKVTIEDLSSGELETYTLSLPDQADAEQGRISVLAPIGTALLGYAEGDEIAWETPGGVRRLRIRSVSQPAVALAAR